MADTDPSPTAPAPGDTPGFPFATALATLAGLFIFVGLVAVAYLSPNYLGDGRPGDPKVDPAAKLTDVRAKNQAVLDGTDPSVKLSLPAATDAVLGHAAKANRLPLPAEKGGKPGPVPPIPAAKGPQD